MIAILDLDGVVFERCCLCLLVSPLLLWFLCDCAFRDGGLAAFGYAGVVWKLLALPALDMLLRVLQLKETVDGDRGVNALGREDGVE